MSTPETETQKRMMWRLHLVQQMFWDEVRACLRLRAIIEERGQ